MADQVDVSGEAAGRTDEPSEGGRPHQFGLTAVMALIVGSIIGVGIFNLPSRHSRPALNDARAAAT
jgi:APA family basic amino acid/polyamine antiporter